MCYKTTLFKMQIIIKGGFMLGAIIGDVVGSRYEFNNIKRK